MVIKDQVRVAVVNTTVHKGGAARAAYNHAKEISKYYSEIGLTFFHAENNMKNGLVFGMRKNLSRYINTVLTRIFGSGFIFDLGFSKKLKQELKDYQVLHLHNIHGYYLNYINLLEYWKNRPLIWTWHDMWGATGRCAFSYECEAWKDGCKTCPNLNYYPAAWIDNAREEFILKDKLYKTFKTNYIIVTPSAWLSNVAIERGFDKERVVTIPYSLNIESFKPLDKGLIKKKLGLECNRKYLLFIAADCNDPRKGFQDFVQIVEKTNITGIAIGKAPKAEVENIISIGQIKEEHKLAEYYNAVDAMIIPTKADNYPNTTMESIACGTPVFGYDVGGLSSQLPDWWDGLVQVDDISGMINKIQKYYDLGGNTDDISTRLREYAIDSWHPEKIANQYMELYRRVLS